MFLLIAYEVIMHGYTQLPDKPTFACHTHPSFQAKFIYTICREAFGEVCDIVLQLQEHII